jgi:chemotaxis protein CheC
MKNYENLNDTQKDVLREIGNIGGGNAATALSAILTGRIDMSLPQLQIVSISEIANLLGGPEKEVVGILVPMVNQVKGMLLFLLDKEFTHMMINVLLDKKIDSFESINEMDMSALKEIGNIMSGSYINAICSLTGLDIKLLPPDIAIDMVGAILNYPAEQFGAMGDKVLYIEEKFTREDESIKSHLLIMPELDSLNLMFERLGVD